MQNVQQTNQIDVGTRVCLMIANDVQGVVVSVPGAFAYVQWDRGGKWAMPLVELMTPPPAPSPSHEEGVKEKPPATKTKREYRIDRDVSHSALEKYEAAGWTIQLMQFTQPPDALADLNVVLVRNVPVDGGPGEDEEEVTQPVVEPVVEPEEEPELEPVAEALTPSPSPTGEGNASPAETEDETPETEIEDSPALPVAEHVSSATVTAAASERLYDSGGGSPVRTVEGTVMAVGAEPVDFDDEGDDFDEDDGLPNMTYVQALRTPGVTAEVLKRIGDREIQEAAERGFAEARAARAARPIEQDPAWVMRPTALSGGTHG